MSFVPPHITLSPSLQHIPFCLGLETLTVLYYTLLCLLSVTPGPFAPPAVALYSSSETVTCVAPAHTQGLVKLGLRVNGMTVRVDGSAGSGSSVGAVGSTVTGSSSSDGISVDDSSLSTLSFTYLGSPIVQGIYPQIGVVGGGDTVTVIGQGWLSLTHTNQMVPTTYNNFTPWIVSTSYLPFRYHHVHSVHSICY